MWVYAYIFLFFLTNQYRYAPKQGKNGSPLGRGCLRGWGEPSIFYLVAFSTF